MDSDGVAFVRADLERFCAEQEGWGLRRIAKFTGVSHEQVRRLLAASAPGASARR